jgi:hypothetical protein
MAKKKSKKRGSTRQPSKKSGGIFTSMRGGMKGLVGTGGKKKKKEITFWDVLFWIAAGLLAAALVYRLWT